MKGNLHISIFATFELESCSLVYYIVMQPKIQLGNFLTSNNTYY